MSTDPKSTRHQEPIPESLHEQLEQFRKRLWRIKVAEAVLAGAFGLLFSFLLIFGLDRVWPTPALVRLAILLGGTSLFAVFAPYWVRRWVFGHRREDQLARLISKSFPNLGDRLLGIIELQDQKESAESLSPRLRGAAMQTVAEEAKRRDFSKALPPAWHRRWSLAVLVVFIGVAAALTLAPKAGMNALKRWLMPLSDTPRYTFTKIEVPGERLVVPFGEAFAIDVALAPDTEWSPDSGTARYGAQEPVSAGLEDGRYHFEFPGQQAPGTVRFQIGDARQEIEVVPTLRPAAERVLAEIQYPEYLGVAPRTADLRSGGLHTVEGSRIVFRLEASRPLASAEIGPARTETRKADAGSKPAPPVEPSKPLPMKVKGNIAESDPIPVDGPAHSIPFRWADEFGLAGDAGFRVRVEAVPDAPPSVYLQGIERQHVMLAGETIDIEALAEDDFGLKSCGLEWTGEFTRPTGKAPAKGEMLLAKGKPSLRRINEPLAFSPGALGIEPQKLTLRAYAEDYYPDRGRVYSEPITLFILTPDEHAQLLKNQFDRLIGELEDLARRELDQFDENQRLDRLDGKQLQEDLNRQRLKEQQDAEHQNAERMKELAKQMEDLFKKSTRNGEIDKDTLKKMAESMKSMKELGEQNLPKVEQKLGEAGDPRNTEEKTDQDVAEAVKEQKKAVDKMQEAIDKANEANRQFEAGTFVNRLKKAASEQDGIAAALIERITADDTIAGQTREELDPTDQRKIDSLVGQESQTASDIRWIEEDLGNFFARTAKEEHRKLLDEMQKSDIVLSLERLHDNILSNKSCMSVDKAKYWAAKLREWARQLEGDKNGGGGGGGGDGGGANPENEDFEFMLRVMRMVQQEQDLRARTRALEQYRRSLKAAKPDSPSKP